MKAAFHCNTWIGCACHKINLVLIDAFQAKKTSMTLEEEGVPTEALALTDSCKELVTLAKRTKVNNKLETTLKQCVPTRWNSILTTLTSLAKNLGELRSLSSKYRCQCQPEPLAK